MALDTERVETITFDSFTTLVDVHGPTREALNKYTDDPQGVATLWRSRAIDYRMLCNFTSEYETYTETTREALSYALEAHGKEPTEEQLDEIVSIFDELDVFNDVADSFERLRLMGYNLYVVSNGTPDILRSIVSRADVDSEVSGIFSAHEVRTYKPAEEFYERAAEFTGTPIDRIVHAATPWYDVFGAMNAGMQAAWVNRRDDPWEKYDGRPNAIVSDLAELVSKFE